ncbi:MAG: SRPBCC domain-containing protein [Alphaproteobacteria bacterium]
MAQARLPGDDAVFTISRTFDAPRALVWKAHTDCRHLMHWWGPKGFAMRHCKIDLRPGGMLHYGLRGPDGSDIWGRIVYRAIKEPERLEFITSFSDEKGGITRHPMNAKWPLQTLAVVVFTEAGGKTRIDLTWTPHEATVEEIVAFAAGKPSMTQGWTGTMDQLAEHLAKAA